MNFTLLGGVKNKAKELINKLRKYLSKERLIALSMLSRVLSMVFILSVFPIGIIKVNAVDSKTNLKPIEAKVKLSVQTIVPDVVEDQKTPQISLGESNYQKSEREKAEKMASESQRNVISRELDRSVPSPSQDPDLAFKRDLAKRAASAYGIDWKLLEAVWQVESGKSWDTGVASYAGAQGPMQFMPGTWAGYAVDADNDGSANINDAEDALYTGAKYLAAGGADRGDYQSALFNYNHAQWYVDKVMAVANSIID